MGCQKTHLEEGKKGNFFLNSLFFLKKKVKIWSFFARFQSDKSSYLENEKRYQKTPKDDFGLYLK